MIFGRNYGETYDPNHPVYRSATLYRIGELGLCVIQQRYSRKLKFTYWTEIDEDLRDQLYLNIGFEKYFYQMAGTDKDGYFPAVTLRKIMWALRMKPLKKEPWETVFDRRFV